jgi:hypothetical protein
MREVPKKLPNSSDDYTLTQGLRWLVSVPTVLLFVWLFGSGWINLWNRHLHPNVFGDWTLWSILAGIATGYFVSTGIILQIEIMVSRRRKRRQ